MSVLKSFQLRKQSNSMTCLRFDNVVLFLGHLHYELSAGQKGRSTFWRNIVLPEYQEDLIESSR